MQNETGDDYVCDGLSSVEEDDPEGRIARNPLGFSPILIRRDMRQLAQSQGLSTVNAAAAIYMASVLDYVCSEILRLAGAKANANREGFARIVPRHIQTAIREDDELQRLLGQATIRTGGVLPNIHALLLPKQTTESAATSDASSNVPVAVASSDLVTSDGMPNLHRTDEELDISAFDIRAASF